MHILKKSFFIFILLVSFASINVARAQQTGSEQINDYQTAVKVNTDGSILVSEKIDYDFGATEHHGIFRTIPYSYQARGGTFKLRISDITVTDDKTNPEPFTTSKSGGVLSIKIGDPDKTITGEQKYVIGYKVVRAINYLSDHDELYWNAIGTEWTVPILKASATLTLPFDATAEHAQADCFVGQAGDTEDKCTIYVPDEQTITYTADKGLGPNEGLTIVSGFPKGLIAAPTFKQNLIYILEDNGILALPILIFLIMFRLWWIKGRDPAGKGTIVPQYEAPKGLSPMEVRTIINERSDEKGIAAEIIYLATLGFIKINYLETKKLLVFKDTDYEIVKVKEINLPEESASFKIFKAFLADKPSIKISELKNDTGFQTSLRSARNSVYSLLTTQGYFAKNPNTVRILYIVLGVLLGLIGSFILGGIFGLYGTLSSIVSGIIMVIFGFFMPARTSKGVEAKEFILGLKVYLSVAEKDRMEFHSAPEKKPEVFEKLLPFAIALGVETQWAKQFEGIYNQQPAWYGSNNSGVFNALILTSSLNNFSSQVHTVAAPRSSASGGGSGFSGGFSGGGFGGGGGGSW